MALLFYGKTVCTLCGKVIAEGDPTTSFSFFIVNEADPCFIFSDGAFHEKCVHKSDFGEAAISQFNEWKSKVGPGKRKCVVCQLEITDPNNYLMIEGLSGNVASPLYPFNYTHIHKSCIPKWAVRDKFIAIAKDSFASDYWKGNYLPSLLRQIDSAG